ncbi:hypothetical protein WN943_001593 [Citrus x changshan-huyou]
MDLGSLVLSQFPSKIETLLLLIFEAEYPFPQKPGFITIKKSLNLYTIAMLFSYINHTADEFWKMNKLRHLKFGSIILPEHLRKYCGSLENLNFITAMSDGFPKLKIVHLNSMPWLEEWTMRLGARPKLECLILNSCAYWKKIPEQLWCKKSLNKFECWWPQPELRQKLRDFEDKAQ